jgi:molybdopterin/thiamine biosynthesis adenylyltransferase
MLGCVQAIEAIKLITGIGDPLVGKILVYDGEACTFYTVKIDKKIAAQFAVNLNDLMLISVELFSL